MDQGLRGQSACLYLLTDLRRFGRWLTSEFHQVARQRQPGHHSSRRIFLFDQLGKFNLIFFFLENNDYDFVLILKNKYSNRSEFSESWHFSPIYDEEEDDGDFAISASWQWIKLI